jgi:hypothetical protein
MKDVFVAMLPYVENMSDFQHRAVLLHRATIGVVWRDRGRQTEKALEERRLESLKQLDDSVVKPWVAWLDAQERWTASELNRIVLYQIAASVYRHTVDGVTEQRKLELAWKDIEENIDGLEKDELENWFIQEVMIQPGRVHGGFDDYEEQVALFTHRARIMFNKIVGKLHESGNPT